ncbi:MAG: polyprenyl synthetase family protein [Candidatus Neomarinimicrobiota bacterium]|nr:MAG: polyprenyl synthetase family protein [Candidatus Neomarinimicrobiota bacterium]
MKTPAMDDIIAPVRQDLKLYEREFDSALHHQVKLINTIGKFLIRSKGKHVRPVITLLAAHVCQQPTDNTYRAAAMVELLHLATLIHDDVVDEAKYRRGYPALNRIWKNKLSVLMGDYILSKSLIYMIRLRSFEALEVISETAEKLSAGEILQIEKSLKRSLTEAVYFDMVSQKTASLMSTAAELGAITSTGELADRERMKQYGLNLGIAFQLKDDLFDFLGSEASLGKDMGADVKRNMMTLPVLHVLDQGDGTLKRKLRRILKQARTSSSALQEANRLLEHHGGFAYTREKIDEYSQRAAEALDSYPDSPAKQSLLDLVHFNKMRNK